MRAMRWLGLMLALALLAGMPVHSQQGGKAATARDNADFREWPHTFDIDGVHMVLHHPQLDSWVNGQLKGRIAVAVKTGTQVGSDGKSHDVMAYGVAWVTARTETDKVLRQVTLSQVTVDKVSFPTEAAQQSRYLDVLRFAHFLALAAVAVYFLPRGWAGLKSPWLRPAILCGQHSLEIFCIGVFLAFAGHFILAEYTGGPWIHFVISISGIVIMSAAAWVFSWYKRVAAKSGTDAKSADANADLAGGGS